ncbi:MAG: hypothetical protein K6E56_00320 [Lachnospiraceae bacterium]|nr:hypothetical protein [Lachnospiraceae bacterium]
MLHMVYNPASQSGRGRLHAINLYKRIKKEHIPVRTHATKFRNHAAELIKVLNLTENDILLVLGGDGSLNELLQGIPMPIKPAVILHPVGSGNDFVRGIEQDSSVDKLIENIKAFKDKAKELKHLDIGTSTVTKSNGKVKNHHFIVSSGMGYDANVCHAIELTKWKKTFNKFKIGSIVYTFIGLLEVGKYDLHDGVRTANMIKMVLDDGDEYEFDDVVFFSAHNTPYEGGGYKFAPDASPTDGFLDICVVTAKNKAKAVTTLLSAMGGAKHVNKENVHMLRCKKASITPNVPMTMHTDGEVITDVAHVALSISEYKLPYIL